MKCESCQGSLTKGVIIHRTRLVRPLYKVSCLILNDQIDRTTNSLERSMPLGRAGEVPGTSGIPCQNVKVGNSKSVTQEIVAEQLLDLALEGLTTISTRG